jgi:hypothetical protein
MLEEQDLKLIKKVIQEVIEEEVTPHFIDAGNQFFSISQQFQSIDQRFERIDGRLENIETTMVTKDYLEDRLSDFKDTLKQSGARAMYQIKKMAMVLHKNGTLSAQQAVEITGA